MTAAHDPSRVSGLRPAVVMLARSPFVAGKTRLTADLAAADASALRVALLLDTLEAALSAGWPLHVHLDPPDHIGPVQALLGGDAALAPHAGRVSWHPQADGDLGVRMVDAVSRTMAAGHDVVVLVGSDIPDLPRQALEAAHRALMGTARGAAVVLGPAADGGFYLVAATDGASLQTGFASAPWGHASVLAEVAARFSAAGREVVQVMPWADLDAPADLATLLARQDDAAHRTREVARRLPPYNGR